MFVMQITPSKTNIGHRKRRSLKSLTRMGLRAPPQGKIIMTKFSPLTVAAFLGSLAIASTGASAHGGGGPMGNFGTFGNPQKVGIHQVVNTPDKFIFRRIEDRQRREFRLRELLWRHNRHVMVKPLILDRARRSSLETAKEEPGYAPASPGSSPYAEPEESIFCAGSLRSTPASPHSGKSSPKSNRTLTCSHRTKLL